MSMISEPPRLLRPNNGLAPPFSVILWIADWGSRSQLTVSPSGSLMRTPFWCTVIPWAGPNKGEAVKPRYWRSGCMGLLCTSLREMLEKL